MAIPKLIPIAYEPDYRTELIGNCDTGPYLGFEMFIGRAVAVLHIFDLDGQYVRSDSWDANDGVDEPRAELLAAIDSLPNSTSGDVAVALFSDTIFDLQFGLIPNDKGDHVEYVPYMLGFNPPWNGLYDT